MIYNKKRCIFCNFNLNVVLENKSCLAFYDAHPVSKGHLLIIPKNHKVDYFQLSFEEKIDMDDLIIRGKEFLDDLYKPDGYNIGLNSGEVAGQSVFHCHCHLIPRYKGDMENPKGGVRGVIPDKMNY